MSHTKNYWKMNEGLSYYEDVGECRNKETEKSWTKLIIDFSQAKQHFYYPQALSVICHPLPTIWFYYSFNLKGRKEKSND